MTSFGAAGYERSPRTARLNREKNGVRGAKPSTPFRALLLDGNRDANEGRLSAIPLSPGLQPRGQLSVGSDAEHHDVVRRFVGRE